MVEYFDKDDKVKKRNGLFNLKQKQLKLLLSTFFNNRGITFLHVMYRTDLLPTEDLLIAAAGGAAGAGTASPS